MSDFGQPPGWNPGPGSQPGGFQQQQPYGGAPPGGGFGPQPGGFGPQGPPPQQQGASGMAIAALVMACLSFVCGGIFLSIPGAILAKMEMNKIAAGESSPAGDGLAKAAFYISLGNIGLITVIGCIYGILMVVAVAAAPH